MVELKASNLSEEETCFELIEDAEYIDHCTFYIEVGAENKSNCKNFNKLTTNTTAVALYKNEAVTKNTSTIALLNYVRNQNSRQ